MEHSPQINEIAAAKAAAQAEMKNPSPEGVNSYQKYKYATAPGYLDMIRGPLTKNNIAFCMDVDRNEDGPYLSLLLSHSSGQWIRYKMPLRSDIASEKGNSIDQAWGSHLTYSKKYLIMLVFGIHGDEDDDGASAPQAARPAPKSQPKVDLKGEYEKVTDEQINQIMYLIGKHTDIAGRLLENFNVPKIADLPRSYYLGIIKKIKEITDTRK